MRRGNQNVPDVPDILDLQVVWDVCDVQDVQDVQDILDVLDVLDVRDALEVLKFSGISYVDPKIPACPRTRNPHFWGQAVSRSSEFGSGYIVCVGGGHITHCVGGGLYLLGRVWVDLLQASAER